MSDHISMIVVSNQVSKSVGSLTDEEQQNQGFIYLFIYWFIFLYVWVFLSDMGCRPPNLSIEWEKTKQNQFIDGLKAVDVVLLAQWVITKNLRNFPGKCMQGNRQRWVGMDTLSWKDWSVHIPPIEVNPKVFVSFYK